MALVLKDQPPEAGDTGLIPGLGRSPGGRKIPWTEELGGLHSIGS